MPTPSRARAVTILLYLIALAVGGCSGCSSCKKPQPTRARGAPLTPGASIRIPLARAAYVTNNASDSISVLDRDGENVETVGVDVDRDAHEAPHHLAVDARAGVAFVALAFPPSPNAKKKDPHATHGASSDVGRLARLELGTLSVLAAEDVDENP